MAVGEGSHQLAWRNSLAYCNLQPVTPSLSGNKPIYCIATKDCLERRPLTEKSLRARQQQ